VANAASTVQMQSAAATATRAAVRTQQAQTSGLLALDGTFSLTQTDSGCSYAAWPQTGGTLTLLLDYNLGTASGSFGGGGSGARTGLRCASDSYDMVWSQTYQGTFSGSLDPASGALDLRGIITGTGATAWQNCRTAGAPAACSPATNSSYSFPIALTGSADRDQARAQGRLVVNNISLVTEGEWSAE
jgi:hypothetical protein